AGLGYAVWQIAINKERQAQIDTAQVHAIAQLATIERQRGNLTSALRLATLAAHLDQQSGRPDNSMARSELSTTLWSTDWLLLGGHNDSVWTASFSPNGSRIVTASLDKTARIWDPSGSEIAVLRGHEDYVMSVAFSPDGSRILTGSVDNTARVWDAT